MAVTRLLPVVLLLVSVSVLGQPQLVVQTGHTEMVTAVDFSPDGTRVLTGAYDQTARIWDVATGKELHLLAEHDEFVTAAAYSPDGQFIATGTRSARLSIFSARAGQRLHQTPVSGWQIYALAWAPDGSRIVTGDHDGSLRIWNAANVQPVRSIDVSGKEMVNAVAFSPDGDSVLVGTMQGSVGLYSIHSGAQTRAFRGHSAAVRTVAYAPDGATVLSGSDDGTARYWDVRSGRQLWQFPRQSSSASSGSVPLPPMPLDGGQADAAPQRRGADVGAVAYSRDGGRLVTGDRDGVIRIWRASDGALIETLNGPAHINAVAFSPDGSHVLSGARDTTARLWSIAQKASVRVFEGQVDFVRSLDVSPDGRALAAGSGYRDRRVSLWSLSGGTLASQLPVDRATVHSLAYSPDGRVLAGGVGAQVVTWDVGSGERLPVGASFQHVVEGIAFSPDGSRLVAGSFDNSAQIIELAGGAARPCCSDNRPPGRVERDHVMSVDWSPDGRLVATGGRTEVDFAQNYAYLWDPGTGTRVRHLGPVGSQVSSVAFSPDGTQLLGSSHGFAHIWEVHTGRLLRRLDHQGTFLTSAVWSADGRRVVTAGRDRLIRVWDAVSGAELQRMSGHSGQIESIGLLRDGGLIVSAGSDGTVRLWDARDGTELCKLVSFADGSWAVIDPRGRFDASNGGEVDGLHWVLDGEVLALSQLKNRFYEPGLLAKLLGFQRDPPPPREIPRLSPDHQQNAQHLAVQHVGDISLHPAVAIDHAPDRSDPVLRVTVTNRGGGIGPVQVLLNGKEVASDIRPEGSNPHTSRMQLALNMTGIALFRTDAVNRVEVFASNADLSLKSRGAGVSVLPDAVPGGARAAAPPNLWAVVVGVSDYRGDDIDLSFAQRDAERFAAALDIAASGLVSRERVHINVLGSPASPATRSGIETMFSDISRRATSSDILVLYLAGHGVTWGAGPDADYYYLLNQAASLDLSDSAARQSSALSSQELTEWIKGVPALKQVLILDTCAAGQLVTDLVKTRGPPSSQMRSLERMKDRTGVFVLAGSAADAVSYEASRYGQGLLTYSLLTGMRGPGLRDDEYVDINQLFSFAADEVQRLVQGLGGVQQPRIGLPRGGSSFDIGRVTAADRSRITVATPKPIVMQSDFRGPQRRDSLMLESRIDRALRDAAAATNASFVFFDTDDYPDAILVVGEYVVANGQVTVDGAVFEGEHEVGSFNVRGAQADLDALAERVVESARSYFR